MTPKEAMDQLIIKALGDGVAKLIKNGLAFTVMALTISGLCVAIYYLVLLHQYEQNMWYGEIEKLKKETSAKVLILESRYYECMNENQRLSVRVAEMEAIVKYRLKH